MKIADISMLGDMKVAETFCYYDGPMIFSIKHLGRTFYVHAYDFIDNEYRYWVREMSPDEEAALKNNEVTLRNFIKSGNPLYSLHENGDETKLWEVEFFDEFSNDCYPVPDVKLDMEKD